MSALRPKADIESGRMGCPLWANSRHRINRKKRPPQLTTSLHGYVGCSSCGNRYAPEKGIEMTAQWQYQVRFDLNDAVTAESARRNPAGGAAEHKFAQARMAVATHYDHIGGGVCRIGEGSLRVHRYRVRCARVNDGPGANVALEVVRKDNLHCCSLAKAQDANCAS
jgi:hypothetical protein